MASDLNVNKTQILLNSVVFSNSLPDFWNPGTDKLTYGVLNELFKFVEENNLSSAVIRPAISLLWRDVSSEINNVFNLKNSVKNFLRQSHDHNNKVYMKLYNNDHVVLPVVGDYCSGLGIYLNTIHLPAFSQLLFRLSSADFQINSDFARYYVGALKKNIF